jgi:hypothetical protein
MAFLYVKSKKILADAQMSRTQKIAAIRKKEQAWMSNLSNMLKGINKQDIAVTVGMKDLAKIYTSLESPDDALRFINVLDNHIHQLVEYKGDNEFVFNTYIYYFYYKGKAYAQKGMIEECQKQFDILNLKLNESIAKDPSKSSLQEMYNHLNIQIYNNYIDIAEKFTNIQLSAYKTCLDQFKTFDRRDPGNEQIQDMINELQPWVEHISKK